MLNGSNSVRRPALKHSCLKLSDIVALNLNELQDEGVIAIWVINKVYRQVLQWLKTFNYKIMKEIFWLKITKTGKLHGSVGHYVQHATETCIIARKGDLCRTFPKKVNDHILWSQRRIQSQKPNKMYEILEQLVPEAKEKIELFGRYLNLREMWKTVGFQVLPDEETT